MSTNTYYTYCSTPPVALLWVFLFFFSLAETFAAIPSVFSYFYSVVYRADGIGTELDAGRNYSRNTSVLQKHIEEIHSGLIRTMKIPHIDGIIGKTELLKDLLIGERILFFGTIKALVKKIANVLNYIRHTLESQILRKFA